MCIMCDLLHIALSYFSLSDLHKSYLEFLIDFLRVPQETKKTLNYTGVPVASIQSVPLNQIGFPKVVSKNLCPLCG